MASSPVNNVFSASCFLFLLFLHSAASTVPDNSIINTNVKRLIDLTSHVARHSVTVSFTNSGTANANTYVLALSKMHADRLASMMIFDSSDKELKVSAGTCEKDTVLFNVSIENLNQGSEGKIRVSLAFTRILEPLPAQIAQSENQLVRYRDNHYFFSPYKTLNQRTEVRLFSQMIESNSEESPTNVKGDAVDYGPYSNIDPFAFSSMLLHFENNSPFASATFSSKSIEISNWGNIAVEESVELEHAGAKLKGFFSRLDYQKNPQTNGAAAIKSLIASLPADVGGLYFRDEVGNISTSAVRRELLANGRSSGTLLELTPRFPLFGGWKTDFHFGYTLPVAAATVAGDEGDAPDTVVLHLNFGLSLNGVQSDNHSLRMVLPEGAADVEVGMPFAPDGQGSAWHWGFLDTVGRPVVQLWKVNVVDEHRRPFQVKYRLSQRWTLREPILAAVALVLLVSACYLHSRLGRADPVQDRIRRFRAVQDRRAAVGAAVARAWRAFCRGGDREALRAAKQQCKERLDACRTEADALADDFDRIAGAVSTTEPPAAGGGAPAATSTTAAGQPSAAAGGGGAGAAGLGGDVDFAAAAAAAAAAAVVRQVNKMEADLGELRAAAYSVDGAAGGAGAAAAAAADPERGAAKMREVEAAIERLVDKL